MFAIEKNASNDNFNSVKRKRYYLEAVKGNFVLKVSTSLRENMQIRVLV